MSREINSSSASVPAAPDGATEKLCFAGWRGIDTAPEGRPIYACDVRCSYEGLVFKNQQGEWECVSHTLHPMGIGFYPTHWFELPKPLTVGADK